MVVDSLREEARQVFPDTDGAAEGLEIELPQAEMRTRYRGTDSDLRRDARYKMELPLRVTWNCVTGQKHEAHGIALDMCKSGIRFLVSNSVPMKESVELEVTLPGEITHSGDLIMKFIAELWREDKRALLPPGHLLPERDVSSRSGASSPSQMLFFVRRIVAQRANQHFC